MRGAVTTQAGSIIHPWTVRLVTFDTLHRFAMFRVTAVAILLGVQAWFCCKSFFHIGVTGLTRRFNVLSLRKVTIEGVVTQMTLLTVANDIMRVISRLMTADTGRDDIIPERWMSPVTTDARLLAVFATMLYQAAGRISVARCANRACLCRSGLNHMWQMWRVTFQAIAIGHFRNVRFMTIKTLLR